MKKRKPAYEKFAELISDTNFIEDLEAALKLPPDVQACAEWGLPVRQWYKAIRTAIQMKKSRLN